MGAALCCGCVVNPSARRSAHLSPFARGLFAKSLGRKGEADHRAHPHSLPPHRLPFLITCSSPGQLWEAGGFLQHLTESALCQPLEREASKNTKALFFFFSIYFPLLIFFSLPLELKMRERKMQEDTLFSFSPHPAL